MPVVYQIRPQINKKYLSVFKDQHRFKLIYGGAGAGKSYFVAQYLLIRAFQIPNRQILCIRKVARTLRYSVFSLLLNILQDWNVLHLCTVNHSMMQIELPNGSQFLFLGLDNVEKLKSIVNITDIWIEEASEITKYDFYQLNLRLRGKSKVSKQIIMTFNPVSELHWIKSEFFDTPRDDTFILQATYKDNKFIDQEYIKVLQQLKYQDEMLYQIYALGEWGRLRHTIYTNYQIIPETSIRFDHIIYGLDFGYNNPTALLKIGIHDDDIYILDEFYERYLTTSDLIQHMKTFVVPRTAPIYADPAEPDRIEEIKRAGFNIHKAINNVRGGIDYIKQRKIYILQHCANTIKEIQSYKWQQDKDGNILDQPVKFFDHAMDAMRYAVYTHFKQHGTAVIKTGKYVLKY